MPALPAALVPPADRYAAPEIVHEDPDVEHRLRDERARRDALQRYEGQDTAPLAIVAILLGEHVSRFGDGPKARRLARAAADGRLRAAGDLRRLADGRRRNTTAYLPLHRDDVRAFLEREGTPDERASAAAIWCGLIEES